MVREPENNFKLTVNFKFMQVKGLPVPVHTRRLSASNFKLKRSKDRHGDDTNFLQVKLVLVQR